MRYKNKEKSLRFLLIRMNYEKQKQSGGKDEQFGCSSFSFCERLCEPE
mgnify:CR=1 FL=1